MFITPCGAVDSRAIEAVRAKKVLDSADLKAIDDFLTQAVNEILNTNDFSSVSNIRSIIIASSASNEPGQVQFAEQFSQSAKNQISAALQKADGFEQGHRFKIITNLLMVLDDLADPRLIDLPLKYAGDKDVVISYWAVHCVTNQAIVTKFNSGKESDAVRKVVLRLDEIISGASPETLGLIASFAGSVKNPEGEGLLLKVADRRIASYADWSVKCELVDASILQILADKMISSGPDKAAAGRRFGQLYSDVFQRYIKGAKILRQSQKEKLISVLVETEKSCLLKLLKKPSSAIKKAIESGDINALAAEHNNLLGDATKQGVLPVEMSFDYGKDNSGASQTKPSQLAEPPPGKISPSAEPPKS